MVYSHSRKPAWLFVNCPWNSGSDHPHRHFTLVHAQLSMVLSHFWNCLQARGFRFALSQTTILPDSFTFHWLWKLLCFL